jgi:hypothetical protein
MKTNRRSRGIAPLILNFNTGWNQVVTLTTWLLYSLGKNPRYALNMRLGGAPELVLMFLNKKKKISCFWQE